MIKAIQSLITTFNRFRIFFATVLFMVFGLSVSVQAQSEWNFDDNSLQGWSANATFGVATVSTTQSLSGDYSIEFSGVNTQRDAFLDFFDPVANATVSAGQWVNYRIYIPEGELSSIMEVAPYHNHGPDFENGNFVQTVYLPEDLVEGEWITVSGKLVNSFASDNLLVMGLVLRGNTAADTPTIYVDDITVTDAPPTDLPTAFDFDDNTLQGWFANQTFGTASVSMDQSRSAEYSVELSGLSTQADTFFDLLDPATKADISAGQWVNYHIYIPSGELASIAEIAPYHNHGPDFNNGNFEQRVYLPEDLVEDSWISVSGQLVSSFASDNLLVIGLVMRGTDAAATPTIYIDDISITDDEVVTSNEGEGTIPGKISLGANYPNPFNPSTQIPFELNNTTNVTLEVYDMLGRKVQVLLNNEVFSAGSHQVTFDATNLPSGIYLYRMVTPGFIQTRKLNLIK